MHVNNRLINSLVSGSVFNVFVTKLISWSLINKLQNIWCTKFVLKQECIDTFVISDNMLSHHIHVNRVNAYQGSVTHANN